MKNSRTLTFSSLFVFVVSFALAQLSEKNYRIYSVKSAKEISINDIADDMKNADVLFFGEEHNDSVTHYLENKMFETLFAKYSKSVAL